MVGLTSPQDQVHFLRHGASLAMYRPIPDLKNFWDDHWGERPIADVIADAATGRLGELEYSLTTFLPSVGKILEAGCGTGRVVKALVVRGFDVAGVDYAAESVAQVLDVEPDLRVEVGDPSCLRWDDGSFDGYISIGVMEHMFDGPRLLVEEAFRVLSPGGRALISVPYRNRLRTKCWTKAPECDVEVLPGGWRFYQDHVQPDCFASYLSTFGFSIIDTHPYGMYGALLRDSRILAALDRHGLLRHRIRALMKLICARAPISIRRRYSHMMMFVCEKP